MTPRKIPTQLTKEEAEEFRAAVKHINPIKKDATLRKRVSLLAERKRRRLLDDVPDYLSDYPAQSPVLSEERLLFSRNGLSLRQQRMLRRGKIPIEMTLDLHGYDVNSARKALAKSIHHAHLAHLRCLLIIHGKGHHGPPILKNSLNTWLRQLDEVLGFASALPQHGGSGAIYVLLKG
jgi:DNA-nicking Smr family endonuclease